MSGRQSGAVRIAVRLVRERGATQKDAARRLGVAESSIRRALRSAGVPPLTRGRRKKQD